MAIGASEAEPFWVESPTRCVPSCPSWLSCSTRPRRTPSPDDAPAAALGGPRRSCAGRTDGHDIVLDSARTARSWGGCLRPWTRRMGQNRASPPAPGPAAGASFLPARGALPAPSRRHAAVRAALRGEDRSHGAGRRVRSGLARQATGRRAETPVSGALADRRGDAAAPQPSFGVARCPNLPGMPLDHDEAFMPATGTGHVPALHQAASDNPFESASRHQRSSLAVRRR
jgi:hypothetical protein